MKPTEEQLRTLNRRELHELRVPKHKLERLARMEEYRGKTPSVNPETPAPDKRPEHANIDSGLLARGQNRK